MGVRVTSIFFSIRIMELYTDLEDRGYIVQPDGNLGKGAFGQVFLVKKQADFYAVKAIGKEILNGDRLDFVESEIEIMKSITSPYVVKIIETINTSTYMYLILEY